MLQSEDWVIDLMGREKLKVKVFKYLLGFTLIIMLILWLLQTVFLNDMYKFVRSRQLDSAIEYFQENIDNKSIQEIIDTIEADKDIMVRITEDYKRPDMHKGDGGRFKPQAIEKVAKFKLSNNDVLSVTFYAMITPLTSSVDTLQIQLILVTLIVMILSIFFAIIISKKISSPIEDINSSAKELSKGNFKTKFHGQGYLEIKELSDTLNKTSSELSKLDSYRRELLANISHDLRTPLSIIYTHVEMMYDFPEEIDKKNLDVVIKETKRLSNLVNDILDVTKIEAGNTGLRKTTYSITNSVKNIVDRISIMTQKEGYIIEFDPEKNITVFADEIKIEQVIYNLLTNSITHSGNNKKVRINQIWSEKEVKYEFIDYGEGIEEKDIDNIWDRYYKVDKTHKRNVIGSGLGLSIVKNIIDLHGGSYGVESIPNEITKFYFILPLQNE